MKDKNGSAVSAAHNHDLLMLVNAYKVVDNNYQAIVKEMGKFTKDKRVTRNIQYSIHVPCNCHANLGYLLPQSQRVMLSSKIRLQTTTNR